jgi:hypothetical protein
MKDISNQMINFMKKHLFLSIGMFLTSAICIIYWQVVHFEFVNFDDLAYVSQNTHVLSGLNIQNVIWASTSLDRKSTRLNSSHW